MSCYHQASAKRQSGAREIILRFHVCVCPVVRLHEHVATSSCRQPVRVATSQTRPCFLFSHNDNTPLPSTALPPSSSTTHTPFSFLGVLHALVHISTAASYHLTNELANMHSHLVATVTGLMAGLAVAQDGTSAHVFPYADRKLLTLQPPTSQPAPALSRPSTPPPWSPSTDVARASVTVRSAL